MMSGVVLVNKPVGLSSQYVVTGVKHAFRAKKAGHTGTLDMMASGMLPVCLNEATKFSQWMLSRHKTYTATIQLGVSTTTGDMEGDVLDTRSVPTLHATLIDDVLAQFMGPSAQIPPMYSALKHQGRPLYALARSGQTVARAPRPIEIFDLQATTWTATTLTCRVRCSKGTYVRTLCEDIASALGTVGHLIALRRDDIDGFEGKQMVDFHAIKRAPALLMHHVLPMGDVLHEMPSLHLDSVAYAALHHGLPWGVTSQPDGLVRLYVQHQFIGLGHSVSGTLRVKRLLSQSARLASGLSVQGAGE